MSLSSSILKTKSISLINVEKEQDTTTNDYDIKSFFPLINSEPLNFSYKKK